MKVSLRDWAVVHVAAEIVTLAARMGIPEGSIEREGAEG